MRQDLIVTKANALVDASYRLGVVEQKVIALLVAQVQPADKAFKPYRFKVVDFAALTGTTSKNFYGDIQSLTHRLLARVVQIQLETGPLQIHWLSSARYFDADGEVEFCFDPQLKPYLLALKKRFTSYRLKNVVQLKSRHSVRMYEILQQYTAAGERTITVPELRERLGLFGREYGAWKDFRVRVLDSALVELSKKTDLQFSYTARKRGRSYYWIDFKIWSARSKELPTAKVKVLKREATACATKTKNNCQAKWANHKEPTSACHWCVRFDTQRAEAAGQQRLPLEPPKVVEPQQVPEAPPTEAEKKEVLAALAKLGVGDKTLERFGRGSDAG